MPRTVRIAEENVEELIDWGKSVHMNLDYLRYMVEPEFPELGPNYLITDGSLIKNNVTCTVVSRSGLLQHWKFADGENPINLFSVIEKV